ncbi:eps5M domain protein [Streptococcus pneumoniae 2070108]|nr:eps5M domain protein [Streptococcus pneumoniae 2070108]
MACGCALVSTAYSGVFEYAIDGENALLSPIKDSVSLATNIIKLIRNHDLRLSIATQATKDMKKERMGENYFKIRKYFK